MKNIIQSKVFLVDDDPFACLLYKKHMANIGFTNLKTFQSGVEFLNAIDENPEIILLDHEMEHVTGFDALKKIKRFNPDAFVIMISGQNDMNTTIDALKYGAFDYIIKGEGDLEKIENCLNRVSILKSGISRKRKSIFKKMLSFI